MTTLEFIRRLTLTAKVVRPIAIAGAIVLPAYLVYVQPSVARIVVCVAMEVVLIVAARVCHRAITYTLPDAEAFIRSQDRDDADPTP